MKKKLVIPGFTTREALAKWVTRNPQSSVFSLDSGSSPE